MPFVAFDDELEQGAISPPAAAPTRPETAAALPAPTPTFIRFDEAPDPFDTFEPKDSVGATLKKYWKRTGLRLASLPDRMTYTIGRIAGPEGPLSKHPEPLKLFGKDVADHERLELNKEIARSFQKVADDKQRKLAHIDEMIEENAIKGRGTFDPVNLAGMVMEAGLGSVAPMIAGTIVAGPAGGAATVAGPVFAEEFHKSNAIRKRTIEESLMDASFKTSFEFVTETTALGHIIKPGGTFIKRVLKGGLAEGTQEMATEVFNLGYDAGVLNETMPFGQAVEQVIAAGIVGSVMGQMTGAVMHPVVQAEQKRAQEEYKLERDARFADITEGGGSVIDSPIRTKSVPDTVATEGGAKIAPESTPAPVQESLPLSSQDTVRAAPEFVGPQIPKVTPSDAVRKQLRRAEADMFMAETQEEWKFAQERVRHLQENLDSLEAKKELSEIDGLSSSTTRVLADIGLVKPKGTPKTPMVTITEPATKQIDMFGGELTRATMEQMPSNDVAPHQFALFTDDVLNPLTAMSQLPMDLQVPRGVHFFDHEQLERDNTENMESNPLALLVEMTPDEFLTLAPPLEFSAPTQFDAKTIENIDPDQLDYKDNNVLALAAQGIKFDDVPMLEIAPDPKTPGKYKVIAHEGRHRSRVMKRVGVDKIPVRIRYYNGGWDSATVKNNPPTVLEAQNAWSMPRTETVNVQERLGPRKPVDIDTFYEARPQPATETFLEMIDKLFEKGQAFGVKIPGTLQELRENGGLDKYAWYMREGWTLRQVVQANKHIPGLVEYLEVIQAWHAKRMQWIGLADQRVKEWLSLSAERSDRLGNFLFDLTEMTYIKRDAKGKMAEDPRWPTDEEFQALAKKHKMGDDMLELYYKVRDDFTDVLDQMMRTQKAEAQRLLADSPEALGPRLLAIEAENARLKNQPYFPLARFGDWTLVVKDKNGKIVHLEAFETEREQKRRHVYISREFPQEKGYKVAMSKLRQETNMYRGLPPLFLETVKSKLELDDIQRDELDQIAFAWSSTRSFVRHFDRRKFVPGYSKDALRTYAQYFFYGAGHLARIEFEPSIDIAKRRIVESSNRMLNAGIDNKIRNQIIDHITAHKDYIMGPENEWAGLRSAGFLWYLGFLPKSALVNLTQVPLVGNSYLAAIWGNIESIPALTKAMGDIKAMYTKDPNLLDTEENKRFNMAVNVAMMQGWLDESFAMDLAAVSESSAIQRMLPGSEAHRRLRQAAYMGAYMFQQAERYNRRVMTRAAWNLAMKTPDTQYLTDLKSTESLMYNNLTKQGFTDAEAGAFLAARDAVQTTQLEYAKWNRAKFMRGKKSVLFLFYNYLQGMLHNFRYMPGKGQLALVYLFAAGIMGLPGAEDLADFAKWAGRRFFGRHFDVEEKFREFMVDIGADDVLPIDLFLHGASRYGFGLPAAAELVGVPFPTFDLSGSLSMGDVIPGTKALAAVGDFEHKFLAGLTDVGGGVVGAGVNMLQMIADKDNPDQWKRWERGFPNILKFVSKSARLQARGFESNRNGSRVVSWSPAWVDPEQTLELIALAGGFQPTRLNQAWDVQSAQMEVINFWQARQKILLDQSYAAWRANSREGLADTKKAIQRYNKEVPIPQLKINGESVRNSIRARERGRAMYERGIPTTSKKYGALAQEVRKNYPEAPTPPGFEVVQEKTVR